MWTAVPRKDGADFARRISGGRQALARPIVRVRQKAMNRLGQTWASPGESSQCSSRNWVRDQRDSTPARRVVHGLWCRLHSTWLGSWLYWCAHMSSVNVPGSALKARRSRRSPSAGSPVIASSLLQRVHVFDNRAQFRTLRRIPPGKMLVAREHAVRQAVVFFEFSNHLRTRLCGRVSDRETSDHTGPVFTACPLFTPWVASARSLRPPPLLSLMNSARDRLRVLEIRILRHPVVSLLMQKTRQFQQIRRTAAVVKPDHAE